ncbi:hypothetical protein HMPREF1624_03025 [Sporothrix schenckii ATCC 58251]|uniref:Methyltransferase domain-containing protein n=1 Tax=Sporothrix schenckii (strain ATCC 58251 / de Perez 2211183) TaxID=1391915 RepID=U7PVN8_SPOS1|nr:hypothetical protein HMPREF1624_03025 [Sporothrix schenckii ATCC 58251]
MSTSKDGKDGTDWSADQYLKFHDERTRAVHDLVHRVPLPGGRFPLSDKKGDTPLRIIDLGCGPGNSTAVLADRFPGAQLSGVDSSPNMIAKARATLPGVAFGLADLRTYAPAPGAADLLLANAVFQWLSLAERLPTVLRLFAALPPGGVFAYQVPDNKSEPTHQAMREVARGEAPGTSPSDPWVATLRELHDRDPIETPEQIYDALIPHSQSVDVWHAVYNHVLVGGPKDIVEWMRGTGLQPWVNALPDEVTKQAFVAAYERRLGELYERRVDNSVIIRYPRLFVVAVKK